LGPSKRSLTLYGLLTYGGALNALLQIPIFYTYIGCESYLVFSDSILGTLLQIGLNVMMALRVYAMYGQSRKIGILLATCFVVSQGVGIASSLSMAIDTSMIFLPIVGCIWNFSEASTQMNFGNNITLCAYDTIMVFLALYIAFKNRIFGTQGSMLNFDTLWGILIRDNVLYFLVAIANWGISAYTFIPNISFTNTIEYGANALNFYTFCILGPVMMLSIRGFDARQLRGGTTNATGADTVEFAAVGDRSQAGVQSSAGRTEV